VWRFGVLLDRGSGIAVGDLSIVVREFLESVVVDRADFLEVL
jgi:hypothetical protein